MDAHTAEMHHQELATFVSVHARLGPAVLWPEYEHPAYDLPSDAASDRMLAEALARLSGVPVRTVRGGGIASAAKYGRMGTPTLAHQMAGTSVWTLRPEAPGGEDFQCRLRSGEVLYVPANRMWSTAGVSGHSQFLLTFFEGQPKRDIARFRPSAPLDPTRPGPDADAQSAPTLGDSASPDGYQW